MRCKQLYTCDKINYIYNVGQELIYAVERRYFVSDGNDRNWSPMSYWSWWWCPVAWRCDVSSTRKGAYIKPEIQILKPKSKLIFKSIFTTTSPPLLARLSSNRASKERVLLSKQSKTYQKTQKNKRMISCAHKKEKYMIAEIKYKFINIFNNECQSLSFSFFISFFSFTLSIFFSLIITSFNDILE